MTFKALFLLWILAAATPAVAQTIYRWTYDKGRVHYGESLPPGQHAEAAGSGNAASTPPSPRDLEIQRRQKEYADRADREQEEKERAVLRNTPAGRHYCAQIDEAIRKAQAGPLPRYDRPPGSYATEDERQAFLKELLELRERNCP